MSSPIPSPYGGKPLDYAAPKDDQPTLARHIGLVALVLYGVGDMVGAGIYATIGTAAGRMGNAVWLGFVAAMVAAMLTGLSYACIASRYPRAAGAAFVTQHAYGLAMLSYVVGLTVLASGLTSMAASSNALADNLLNFLPGGTPRLLLIGGFIGVLTAINFWGIRESMWVNAACTLIEVGGLVFIIAIGARWWGGVDYLQTPPLADGTAAGISWALILSGATLTFFAFIGFEDMLNIAEECREPERTMPWGIVIAVVVATLLYIAVSITAVSVVPYDQLADTKGYGAPLTQISAKAAPWLPGWVFTGITLFAVANTSLLNYVMGSRLVYGMSRQGLLPAVLGAIHPWRRTPHVAILCLMVVALALASAGNIAVLAQATSLLLLSVFAVVNSALVVLKFRVGEPPGRFEVPWAIPALGALVCVGLIYARLRYVDPTKVEERNLAVGIAFGLIAFAATLYVVVRPKVVTDEQLAAMR